MKILMLLSNPFMVDPRVYNEAKALVDAGHEVSVIVWDRKKTYKKEDTVEGIRLFRIHNKGLMNILPHDIFRNPLWWWNSYKKGLKLYKKGFNFDVVHCHDLDTLLAGVWLKKKLGCKLVYDAHEIFGYMIFKDLPQFIVRFTFFMEKILVKNVDHIITVNKPLEDYFASIVKKTPISVVMNCKELISDEYTPSNNNVFTLIFIGVVSKSRMFPDLIDIVGKIKGVKFTIYAKKENIYDLVMKRCKEYSNIDFLGQLSFDQVIPTTLKSDAVILILDPYTKYAKIALANKQFEAMVCGRPIITTKETYVGELTTELNCGLVVNYNNTSIKKAIIKLRDNKELCERLGRNGLDAAKNIYNWKNQKQKLLSLYQKIGSDL
jgi:glycosyltransferase involved in cell wall biosynthesis